VRTPETGLSRIRTLDLDGTIISGRMPVPSPFVDIVEAVLYKLQKLETSKRARSTRNLIIAMMRYLARRRTLSTENRQSLLQLHDFSRAEHASLAVLSGRQSYLVEDTLQHLEELEILSLFDFVYLNREDKLSAEFKAEIAKLESDKCEEMTHVDDDLRAGAAVAQMNRNIAVLVLNSISNDFLASQLFRTPPDNLRFVDSFPQAVSLITGEEREASRFWSVSRVLR